MKSRFNFFSLIAYMALACGSLHAKVMVARGVCTIFEVNRIAHRLYMSHSPDLTDYRAMPIEVVFTSDVPSGYEKIALSKLNMMRNLNSPEFNGSYLRDFRKNPLQGPIDTRCYSYLMRQCDLTYASPLYSYIHPESMTCVEADDSRRPVLIPNTIKTNLPSFDDALKTFREVWQWSQGNLQKIPWYVYAQILAILIGVGLWKAGLLVTTGVGALEPLSVILAVVAIISLLAPHMDETSKSKYHDYIQAGTELIHQEKISGSEWALTINHPVLGKPWMKITTRSNGSFTVDKIDAQESSSPIVSGNIQQLDKQPSDENQRKE